MSKKRHGCGCLWRIALLVAVLVIIAYLLSTDALLKIAGFISNAVQKVKAVFKQVSASSNSITVKEPISLEKACTFFAKPIEKNNGFVI